MLRYLAVLAVILTCFTGDVSAVTDQEFQDLVNIVERQGSVIMKQTYEISELREENQKQASEISKLKDENRRQEVVINQLQAVLATQHEQYDIKTGSQADLVQNTTIEERVSLLELQVADLDEDVDFLFDEQVIQDERLFTLETGTDELNEEVEDLQDITQALDFRVTELEENGGSDGNSSISELEERVETLEGTVIDHEIRITSTEEAVEDLEVSSADHETRLTAAEENIQETIAFYAVLTTYDTIPFEAVQVFNVIILNKGNGYDRTTGFFTVPPGGDGVYYFSTYLRVENGESAWFDMVLNNVRICTTWGDHTSSGNDDGPQSTCSAVVSVVEGDEVKLVREGATDDTPLEDTGEWFFNGFNGFRI